MGYTFAGRPVGVRLQNYGNFAIAAQYLLSEATQLYGEVLGSTASIAAGSPENTSRPEAGGGELVGSVGVGRYVTHTLLLSVGVSYDNTGAILLRPGFNLRLR